mmetsp:Transcript_13513/g.29658  ORF Transcript_13513/g.29658 Transcript_13513/m.29658 type:complete len:234 (-) Transcript_13513:901-1602(-)
MSRSGGPADDGRGSGCGAGALQRRSAGSSRGFMPGASGGGPVASTPLSHAGSELRAVKPAEEGTSRALTGEESAASASAPAGLCLGGAVAHLQRRGTAWPEAAKFKEVCAAQRSGSAAPSAPCPWPCLPVLSTSTGTTTLLQPCPDAAGGLEGNEAPCCWHPASRATGSRRGRLSALESSAPLGSSGLPCEASITDGSAVKTSWRWVSSGLPSLLPGPVGLWSVSQVASKTSS